MQQGINARGCRQVPRPCSGWCGWLDYLPCQPYKLLASTSGPGDGAKAYRTMLVNFADHRVVDLLLERACAMPHLTVL